MANRGTRDTKRTPHGISVGCLSDERGDFMQAGGGRRSPAPLPSNDLIAPCVDRVWANQQRL